MNRKDRIEYAAELRLYTTGKTRQFCENIVVSGRCSDKQFAVLEKIEKQWLKSITPKVCSYYEECYEENTNSYY